MLYINFCYNNCMATDTRREATDQHTDAPPSNELEFVQGAPHNTSLPIATEHVVAGFPAASDGYDFLEIDLNRHLITNRSATFLARVTGNSMIDAGIHENDILIIDRSQAWRDGAIAVCMLNNEFTVKYIRKENAQWYLAPANTSMPSIPVRAEDELVVWGIVTYIIHRTQ